MSARRMPRLVEMRAIHISCLFKHPDAEAFGAEAEDRAALAGSVAECGLLDPLSVVPEDAEGCSDAYWVIDGCGRLESLFAMNSAWRVPCMVFDLGDFSPREFALHRNTMQRKVTTGQRVLCYLQTSGALSRESTDGGTVRTVAQRLGCSQADVVAASELCREAEGQGADGAAREVYEAVLAGKTPIRRWKAAVKGIEATRDRPKRPVDYAALCARVCASLGTIFRAWPELTGATKGAIEDALRQCLDGAPWQAGQAERGSAIRTGE